MPPTRIRRAAALAAVAVLPLTGLAACADGEGDDDDTEQDDGGDEDDD
jgi:hypothetical protein